jgi:hypothetical protein
MRSMKEGRRGENLDGKVWRIIASSAFTQIMLIKNRESEN